MIKKIKKPKHSSANINDIENEDFISNLPDEMLTRILSLLPDADANRSRIYSNRWKDLWAFLPNLHFDIPFDCLIEKINKFYDLIDQTLFRRGGMPIQRFVLQKMNVDCDNNRVNDCLRTVVRCQVQEIELVFPADKLWDRFSWNLFDTCNTLVVLTLLGSFELHLPKGKLVFPFLKKINLVAFYFVGAQSLENLISSCTGLEELCLERPLFTFEYMCDNIPDTFLIFSRTLKRLKISFTIVFYEYSKAVYIDAPKLEYVYIEDAILTDYFFKKPLSLVEAHICCHSNSVSKLVPGVSSAKILTLTYHTIEVLHSLVYNLPMFPNLVKLLIDIDCILYWHLLQVLLDNMPNLEHITFLNGLLDKRRIYDDDLISENSMVDAPDCLYFKMKEIIIQNPDALVDNEFTLIIYLLKHSNNLEKLKVNAHGLYTQRHEQLLNFHRASSSCDIELV